MRLLLVAIGFIVVFIASYLLWGEHFDQLLGGEQAADNLRSFGPWAWAVAVGLLVADVLLPIPATAVIATLGIIYGPWLGGAIGAGGSFLAGAVAYLLCRALGERGARRLLGDDSLQRGHAFFTRAGGWTVALSRWMIILPEMISCLAGLTRMPARQYFTALACGSVPMGFAYAFVGHYASDRPVLALTLSAAVPVALWPVARRLLGGRRDADEQPGDE